MEWTGLNELREKFLSFFESKGHLRLPSFSLVPQGDKSLLLINSGMAPMKKYFTGEVTPPRNRVTTCQKCIRTPDIERVGKTSRHGTYFEMLGNFSFGDYFKNEAIEWAWTFFTDVLEIPADKLYVSVYEEDDEAYEIWNKKIGVDASHIVHLGKEDNFWEHGAGPCGPCSEIYFDRGEEYGCGSPTCGVGCDCDRYTEVWNLVFTQFKSDGEGHYDRLDRCNIDTGMGLERLACVMQGVDNLFEVDTVQNIMKHIMKIAGIRYHENEKNDVSLRVITDHIRSTTFMIGDGVIPSNEGKGYVLRRLLRRAARHGKLLGIDRPFLAEVCETVIRENENAYPNLAEKREYIVKIIKMEEENFNKTIDSGLQLLMQMIERTKGNKLSGEDAFKLSDTYGFPIDLTKEILEEKGLSVDEEAFARLAEEQRKRSRDARKDAGAEAWKDTGIATNGLPATEFVGYDTLQNSSEILAVIVNGERRAYAENGENATVVLAQSCFYAESGGQVGDIGMISCADAVFEVNNTVKTHDGVFLHHGAVISGEAIRVGDAVEAKVDKEIRNAVMRNHTAAHLLQASLRKVLGNHVEQAGQLVDSRQVRFDFTNFSAMTQEELQKTEQMVNQQILNAYDVVTEEMPIDKAKEMGAMALFGEKYGDIVRVVKAGDFSVELCGGTHVKNTGSLGLFKIVGESSVAAGVRRIEAVTGTGVLHYIEMHNNVMAGAARAMKLSNISDLDKRAEKMMSEIKEKDREIEKLSEELASIKAKNLTANAQDVGSVKLIATIAEHTSPDDLRAMCEAAKRAYENAVVVIIGKNEEKGTLNIAAGCAEAAVKAGAHAGNIAREVAKLAGGSGGGKPDMAMAGGKDIAKAQEALNGAAQIVASMLK